MITRKSSRDVDSGRCLATNPVRSMLMNPREFAETSKPPPISVHQEIPPSFFRMFRLEEPADEISTMASRSEGVADKRTSEHADTTRPGNRRRMMFFIGK